MTPRQRTPEVFKWALAGNPHISTLKQWQEISGVQRSTFYNAVYGKAEPSVTIALRIAKAGCTSVEILFGHLLAPDTTTKDAKERKPAT